MSNQDEAARHKVFLTALRHQKDAAQGFFAHFGQNPEITDVLRNSEGKVKKKIRETMVESRPPHVLFAIEEMAAPERSRARFILDQGHVAAVDGTNALDPLDLMVTGFYGCAVGYVTSQHRGTPVVRVTRTSTKYAEQDFEEKLTKQKLAELCETLDQVKEVQSWPTTFREYVERQVAIECPAPVILVDGPIFTQNLSTQPAGRDILDRINAESDKGRTFIGVIKNINASSTMTKWCGYSLKPGEGFVINSVASILRERYKDERSVLDWASTKLPNDYVRVVYMPNRKAFGMECRLRDLPLAMAIALEDASPTLNHELPMLIETVDAQIRAGFDASAAHRIVRSKIQGEDLQMGINVTDEREYR